MPMRRGAPMPKLTGAAEWFNGAVSRDDLIGSPALIHFWAKSCGICHENMPTVAIWREEYRESGLKVVAVHMPREPEDMNIEEVQVDLAGLGITEPCAIDNSHSIGDSFENNLWPAYFLFDSEGILTSRAAGYAGLKMIEAPLRRLMEPPG